MSLDLRHDVPLAPLTTLGLGGPATHLVDAADAAGLREALDWSRSRDLPVLLLGGGSNLVLPDAGYRGLVLRTRVPGLAFEARAGRVVVRAGAGVPWDEVVRASVERGLAGIECLSGIPGWCGAAPVQNIGAYGQELAETLVAVTAYDRDGGEVVRLPSAACGFGYRNSRFKSADRDRFVILSLSLALAPDARPRPRYPELADAVAREADLAALSPGEALRLVRERVLALRRAKSMVIDPDDPDTRSAGSFFLNPVLGARAFDGLVERLADHGISAPVPSYPAPGGVKVPAAWLVERAGFHRGQRHGGVGISSAHALALVNRHGTTAELLELAVSIQDAVERISGLRLEIEPTIVESPPA
ncbi:MAG: UDP-N-acetylmuramate dehydrogenase [Candidatus Palauibacterales bacterium]|nr:UDP-N-acetylmuramate dehydrogenase [Candidatus Palauibacterales bacterium]MDP2529089.1 UDP-N-acetylmuramate dehydrogenase [Candidatus Palauibacterales bacterium]